jgi:hypothetical protein
MEDREIEALCGNYYYQEMIDEKENPESREDFAQRMVDEFVEGNVRAYELNLVKTRAEEDYIKDPEATVLIAKIGVKNEIKN